MPSDSEIEKVLQDLLALCQSDIEKRLRDALRRGIQIGSERNLSAIAQATEILTGIKVVGTNVRAGHSKKGCADAARRALARVALHQPADVSTICAYIVAHIDPAVTVSQVRSALKNLVVTGEAENVSWGKYRASAWLAPANGHKVQLMAGGGDMSRTAF